MTGNALALGMVKKIGEGKGVRDLDPELLAASEIVATLLLQSLALALHALKDKWGPFFLFEKCSRGSLTPFISRPGVISPQGAP